MGHSTGIGRSAGLTAGVTKRGVVFLGTLLMLTCLGLASLGTVAWGQLSDDSTTSTQGTQFVKEPKKPEPKKVEPPKAPAPPAAPQPAAVPAPKPLRPPPKAPPRYPSVVFLVDTSDSMLNAIPGRGTVRLAEAKSALIQVLRGMSPDTRVQIWSFNTVMRPLLVPRVSRGQFVPIGEGKNRELLVDQVRRLRTAGGTNLYRSIIQALRFFAHPRDQEAFRTGQRFPVLVLLSDGEDGGKTPENLAAVQKEKKSLPLVTVNTIGFHVGGGSWFKTLCAIATRPQGCATANDGPQLQKMLESFHRPRKPPAG